MEQKTTRIDLRGVNAYLIDGEAPTLVDTGWRWNVSSVRKALEDTGHTVGDVEKVLITHYDVDHVGGLRGLARAGLDATVYAAEPDASFLDGTEKPPLGNRKGIFQRLVGIGMRKPPLPIERVEDGDELAGLEACGTPGHTPGHTAYLGEEVAFLGDAVRENGGSLEVMPSFMSYDAEKARRSLDNLIERFEGNKAYLGHGNPVENASERLRELNHSPD